MILWSIIELAIAPCYLRVASAAASGHKPHLILSKRHSSVIVLRWSLYETPTLMLIFSRCSKSKPTTNNDSNSINNKNFSSFVTITQNIERPHSPHYLLRFPGIWVLATCSQLADKINSKTAHPHAVHVHLGVNIRAVNVRSMLQPNARSAAPAASRNPTRQ